MARENEVKKCGVGLQFNTSKTKLMTMLKKEARRLKACVNLFFYLVSCAGMREVWKQMYDIKSEKVGKPFTRIKSCREKRYQ